MRLPAELRDVAAKRINKGETLRDCAAWLATKHGITISRAALSKLAIHYRVAGVPIRPPAPRCAHCGQRLPKPPPPIQAAKPRNGRSSPAPRTPKEGTETP